MDVSLADIFPSLLYDGLVYFLLLTGKVSPVTVAPRTHTDTYILSSGERIQPGGVLDRPLATGSSVQGYVLSH